MKKNNRHCSSVQRPVFLSSPSLIGLTPTQLQLLIHSHLIRIRNTSYEYYLSSLHFLVHKGNFWDFITAKQERVSQLLIVLNYHREAVVSCDYRQKERENKKKSKSNFCSKEHTTQPTFSLPKATEESQVTEMDSHSILICSNICIAYKKKMFSSLRDTALHLQCSTYK